MENYKKAYFKLFNFITHLNTQTKDLILQMEAAQIACEEIIMNPEEDEEP